MLIGVDVNAKREFTLPFDSTGDPTVWLIGQLDPFVAAAVKDLYVNYSVAKKADPDAPATVSFDKAKLDILIVRLGIKGWRNFKVRQGEALIDLEFGTVQEGIKGLAPQPMITKECMRFFHTHWMDPLSRQVVGENFLTPDQEGN